MSRCIQRRARIFLSARTFTEKVFAACSHPTRSVSNTRTTRPTTRLKMRVRVISQTLYRPLAKPRYAQPVQERLFCRRADLAQGAALRRAVDTLCMPFGKFAACKFVSFYQWALIVHVSFIVSVLWLAPRTGGQTADSTRDAALFCSCESGVACRILQILGAKHMPLGSRSVSGKPDGSRPTRIRDPYSKRLAAMLGNSRKSRSSSRHSTRRNRLRLSLR